MEIEIVAWRQRMWRRATKHVANGESAISRNNRKANVNMRGESIIMWLNGTAW